MRTTHRLGVVQLLEARPPLLGGRAQEAEHAVDGVQLATCREQHLLGQQLRHDAAAAPHVHRRAVLHARAPCRHRPPALLDAAVRKSKSSSVV